MDSLQAQQFASDNYSGICPEAMRYLQMANHGHVVSYGEDSWTKEACDELRSQFETDCDIFFVFNGTAANSLALAALCQSYHSIICAATSHVETDECGAPEFYSNGAKLLLGRGEQGKLEPESIEEIVNKRSDIHFPKPHVISLTQSTELGTVYRSEELMKIREVAKRHHLRIHMDGARFANALAFLHVSPKEISWQCGIDVLCLGGTKNGLPCGEAILFFNKPLAEDFAYRCKQAGQLASKMRFLAAPWLGLLKDGTWRKNASHANACAALLEEKIRQIPEASILLPREANAVFVQLPQKTIQRLYEKGWRFYTFIGDGGVRLMTSWDTTEAGIDAFLSDLRASLASTN
jgi:threonine aldolase